MSSRRFRTALLGASALVGAAALMASPAAAREARQFDFDMPAQPLTVALKTFGATADQQLIFSEHLVQGRQAPPLKGAYTPDQALSMLLAGSGLSAERTPGGVVTIRSAAQDPQGASAVGGGAEVEALIVTAQKREEDIQDVPIAISAFTQESLERSQIAGGPDLITQVPNMTFTKTNFASYSIQIRGIGTQAISATTDAAVAVAFNNSSMIRNRFFEQEFYDLQRVEVLRGPQGTLYGRNATAGVVNIITALPSFRYEAKVSGDVSNYNSTRLEGMVNIPLVEDMVALRLAGAWTKRDGFVTNEISGNQIDGRDLWSTRASLRFTPSDALEANLVWEHFEEDDDRLRSGKQVCKRDDRTEIGGIPRPPKNGYAALFSQGCLAASMYAPESYQAPDGFSLPYYHPLGQLFLPVIDDFDPYASTTQSRDLRVIESTVDPEYMAKSDVGQLRVSYDLSDTLTLASETVYSADTLFSMQDFNRFNTSSGAFTQFNASVKRTGMLTPGPNGYVFCDPQIGCADRLVAIDLSTAESRQFSQEFRISSDYDHGFNFSLGANFLRYDTEDKYYVFINTLTLYSTVGNIPTGGDWPGRVPLPYVAGVSDNRECLPRGPILPDPNLPQRVTGCMYIDPNPIHSLNDQGHNYFLSKNPYKLISYAVFGEAYYDVTESLKLTAGLRFTVDKKEAPRIPSWLLAAWSVGYPVAEVISQEWREPTGRVAIDWKPDLSFTDETLLYASYAHGYKAGGANPPGAGIVSYANGDVAEELIRQSATHPKTFAPEFVDAFEVGAKNTLLDGRLTLNLGAFFYDYEGYQISYIVDRSAVNLNFDAQIWGLELEADWRPLDNLRLGLKAGYENTRVADGSKAIDVMDRTAGNPDWLVVRPFPSFPSNCIMPVYAAAGQGVRLTPAPNVFQNGNPGPCEIAYLLGLDPVTQLGYVENPTINSSNFNFASYFPGYIGFNPLTAPNNGEGFYKDLSGNELPNAPAFTGTLTADYTVPLPSDWAMTLHGDLHYQGESWTRIFNTDGYDKLKAVTNLNLAAIFTNEDAGWKVMAYVKNVFDSDAITGAFLNSDDTGLTTNVFLIEPRLYGLRVTKDFSGGSIFGGLAAPRRHEPGEPYRFEVEIGASTDRFTADTEPFSPDFVDIYEESLPVPLGLQNQDLDRGEQREVKLTYNGSQGWKLSAAVRYGKVNGNGRAAGYEQLPGATRIPLFNQPPTYQEGPVNYVISTVFDHEEHTIADFAVGKDIGLGANVSSTAKVGLRYAKLSSVSAVETLGAPDFYLPAVFEVKYPKGSHTEYEASLTTNRTFEGFGPTVSWDASLPLLGSDSSGTVSVDWGVAGGVLFGKQRVEAEGNREATRTQFGTGANAIEFDTPLYNAPITISRSEKVTVPTLGLSLGASYAIGGVKVGAGYRWERYFDAIDGGYEEAETFARTIDGPYFKIAVGFGG